jgi:hypothetical protein
MLVYSTRKEGNMNKYEFYVITEKDMTAIVEKKMYSTNSAGEGLFIGEDFKQILGTCQFRANSEKTMLKNLNRQESTRIFYMSKKCALKKAALINSGLTLNDGTPAIYSIY